MTKAAPTAAADEDSTDSSVHALMERLDDLAERVLAGEVVFFVGAGFSYDSERNSAKRLLWRLLARFFALHAVLNHADLLLRDADNIKRGADLLKAGLINTFSLKSPFHEHVERNLNLLSSKYYEINDWICGAFAEMAGYLYHVPLTATAIDDILLQINRKENKLLEDYSSKAGEDRDRVPLDPIPLDMLRGLEWSSRGKALFLHAMGFANPAIMAGDPNHPSIDAAQQSYRQRLYPRHLVLARLAREGLCQTLLTTNFDLLLEGAYRLSGFLPRDLAVPSDIKLPPARWPTYNRITNATQFYYSPRGQDSDQSRRDWVEVRRGGQQSATLIKIHGCADGYRLACRGTPEAMQVMLRSLVFTFREIQNWREDSWSRDYVQTLLRTRTMVFCGYSTADPVLHDTFRTVYEEMARRVRGACHVNGKKPGSEEAPAFFLGNANSQEFHALEVLRAASQSIGADTPPLTFHPNYLGFNFLNKGNEKFPTLDEVMIWTYHRVYRLRQAQALESELRGIVALLMGKEVGVLRGARRVIENFQALCEAEKQAAVSLAPTVTAHEPFQRITDWTVHFHPNLLREFALADLCQRDSAIPQNLRHLREKPWYFAAGDNFGWTAWGVVVEIALRRMAAAWMGSDAKWTDPALWSAREYSADSAVWLESQPDVVPAVTISKAGAAKAPLLLRLRFRDFDRPGHKDDPAGLFNRKVNWTLQAERLPWDRADDTTPDALTLWKWACLPLDDNLSNKESQISADLNSFFGGAWS